MPRSRLRMLAAALISLGVASAGRAADDLAAAGQTLATRGAWDAGVPACASCHAADGLGTGKTFPALTGKPADVTRAQLEAFRDGSRVDEHGLMAPIAKRLTDAQIAAVAAYYAQGPRPPAPAARTDGDFASVVAQGEAIFRDPATYAGAYVGNTLTCQNCHLDAGRRGNSAPLGPAYVKYPAYRTKTHSVTTFAQRLQGCFRYSMNGREPPLGDPILVALESYSFALAKGAPVGTQLPGQGYPKLASPAQAPDFDRGAAVFNQKCALCHGADGAGQTVRGQTVFPALWGDNSFNWGAGMTRIPDAAGFIKANMPFSQGSSLTDQEAWDVAFFVDSHERPQDPRFTGDVEATRKLFHDSEFSMYGREVRGRVLGAGSTASGPRSKPGD